MFSERDCRSRKQQELCLTVWFSLRRGADANPENSRGRLSHPSLRVVDYDCNLCCSSLV